MSASEGNPQIDDEEDLDAIRLTTTEESEVDEDREYFVERVLSDLPGDNGEMWYLIKWEGYVSTDSTWEPAHNLQQSTIDDWEHEKERIKAGEVQPFDVEQLEREKQALEEKKEKERERKRRLRALKRQKLGLPPKDPVVIESDSEAEPEQGTASAEPRRRVRQGRGRTTSIDDFVVSDDDDGSAAKRKHRRPNFAEAYDSSDDSGDSFGKKVVRQSRERSSGYQGTSHRAHKKQKISEKSSDAARSGAKPNRGGLSQSGHARPGASRPQTMAEPPSCTGYAGTANRAVAAANIFASLRGRKATRGGGSRVLGKPLNFTGAPTPAVRRNYRDERMINAAEQRQHFNKFSEIRKADMAARAWADRAPDISAIGPLMKPSEVAASKRRPVIVPVPPSGGVKTQEKPAAGTPTDDDMHWTIDDGDAVGPSHKPGSLSESKADVHLQDNLTPASGLPRDAAVPSTSTNAGSQPQQQIQQTRTKKVSIQEYKTRKFLDTMGSAIPLTIEFGPDGPSAVVALQGTDKNAHTTWVEAMSKLDKIVLDSTILGKDIEAVMQRGLRQVYAQGAVKTDNDGAKILGPIADTLKPILGMVFRHQSFNIVFYPPKCDDWKFLDKLSTAQNDGLLSYAIFDGKMMMPVSMEIEVPEEVSKDVAEGNYLKALLAGTLGLKYEDILPLHASSKTRRFFLIFPDSAGRRQQALATWLRQCDPNSDIYTSEKAGAWSFFTQRYREGTVIMHDSVVPGIPGLPNIRGVIENNVRIYCWTENSTNKLVEATLGRPLVELFPVGTAVLLTPSFLRSEPKRVYEVLGWLDDKLKKVTKDSYHMVLPHGCVEYLLDIYKKAAHAKPTATDEGATEHRHPYEMLNYETVENLTQRSGFSSPARGLSRDNRGYPISFADEIDLEDEAGLIGFFGTWSMLHLTMHRQFIIIGTSTVTPSPVAAATTEGETPESLAACKFMVVEGTDEETANEWLRKADYNVLAAINQYRQAHNLDLTPTAPWWVPDPAICPNPVFFESQYQMHRRANEILEDLREKASKANLSTKSESDDPRPEGSATTKDEAMADATGPQASTASVPQVSTMECYEKMKEEGKDFGHIFVGDWEACWDKLKIAKR